MQPVNISVPLYRPLLPQLALLAPAPSVKSPAFEIMTQRSASNPVTAQNVTRGSGILTRPLAVTGSLKPHTLPAPTYATYHDMLPDLPKLLRTGTIVILTRHGESLFNRLGDVFYASMDSPLIGNGRTQAKNLGGTLKNLPIRAIYASPVERAKHTAEIIQSEFSTKIPLLVNSDLKEIAHGLLDSLPKDMTSAEMDVFYKRIENPLERKRLAERFGLSLAEMDYALNRSLNRRKLVKEYCAQQGISEDEAIREAIEHTSELDYAAPIDGESFASGYERAKIIKEMISSQEAKPGAVLLAAHGMLNKELLLSIFNIDLESRKQLKNINQDNCCINVLWKKTDSDQWQLLVLNDSPDGSPGEFNED